MYITELYNCTCYVMEIVNVHVWFCECHTKILNAAIIIQQFMTIVNQVMIDNGSSLYAVSAVTRHKHKL